MSRATQYAAVAIVTIAAGCATKGYQKSESTAEAARTAKTAVTAMADATKTSLASLNTLFGEPRQDLPIRLESFSKDVDAMTSANSRLQSAVVSLRVAADARFKSWDSENATLSNSEVRTHAEQRRAEVFAVWQQTEASMDKGVAFAGSVSTQFAELRKMLASDLTPAGVESASGLAGKARSEAEKLVESTKTWNERLDAAIESASTGPTSPPPATEPAK
jgi:hypothetical protein